MGLLVYGGTCRFDLCLVPNALIVGALKSGYPPYVEVDRLSFAVGDWFVVYDRWLMIGAW